MKTSDFNRIKNFGLRASMLEDEAVQRVVAKVALICDGKICMGKRNDTSAYTTPGGHVEAGETPAQGAVREVYEETGIQLETGELKPLAHAEVEATEGDTIQVHAYQAEVDSTRTTTKEDPDGEVSKWEWFDIKNGKLPTEVSNNLHIPASNDILLQSLGLVTKEMGEAVDAPKPAPTPKPAAPAKAAKPNIPGKPDPSKSLAPTKPAPAAPPPAPVPPTEDKLDAVKKLQKMGDKVFKALDDMAIYANEQGLKDIAAMVGQVEDAYWDMKRQLSKIRE